MRGFFLRWTNATTFINVQTLVDRPLNAKKIPMCTCTKQYLASDQYISQPDTLPEHCDDRLLMDEISKMYKVFLGMSNAMV